MLVKDLLLRLGTENLIKFIDNDLFKIIQLRDKSILKQKNFTEIILKLNSEKKLLSDDNFRKILIDSLKENEARIIAENFLQDKKKLNLSNFELAEASSEKMKNVGD